ncbi:acyltransferase family protein [Streptomyces sp. NBC_00825]|uniref:acyltransferase family protein n=1 Tax=unclassified Streptomyces TaxID=2593676 RepID=UPI00225580B7|nr:MULTISPECIES: acyltransferase family protein [unclassified Streptomyces]WTB54311.1 acyltransferase family protein [Streptomyces sp. NBC_00826]WTH92800.1 acyltransferase family protein [Streptomyces sp. NBC_00825]WTI01531.1 acyltransferase family protein [Streptomyces sp. NBC_00822]MCX4867122.1 acyltransferase family protein [Streptomyces sp. NBC_00906]MCX4898360.1 acyltransferase family protein [Streptomyces sp. NBC_00892]
MFHAPNVFQRAPLPSATRESEPRHRGTTTATAPPPAPVANKPPGAAPAKRRDAYFDNVKYLAIVLVAVAHSWEPVMDGSRTARALYMVAYTFHMPAFIIVSGYFSRSFDMSAAKVKRLVTGVAVPYVVFETAYSLFRGYADDAADRSISLLDPWYLTWFLIALFVWRLTTPIWQTLRHPLPVALVIAVLASLCPTIGDDLDLQRVLQFLPFFVLGLRLKPEHFELVRRREVRMAALPLFAGALCFAYWVAPRMQLGWFYRSNSAQEMGAPWWSGAVMTLAMFGCALLLTIGFLAWVPRRRMWFTVLGSGTICGYLLHGFLIKGAGYAGVFDVYDWLAAPVGLVLVSVVTAVAVTLMCTPPVRRVLRPVTEPDMDWAFRRASARL